MTALGFKLKVRLPDGRMKLCGCGTRDEQRYNDIRKWIQQLKHGPVPRIDVLEAIVLRDVPLPLAYDGRGDLTAVLGMSAVRNIEPLVARWHAEKAASRKGTASADKYERQVRELVPLGKAYLASRFTASEVRGFLRRLTCQDPTRNRYKAALSSFGEYLVDEGVLERNPVRDVRGFSEGQGREEFYEPEEAQAIAERMTDSECAAGFALACNGLEWQAITRLRLRDVDLTKGSVFADGGKNRWRRRTVKIVWPWVLTYLQRVVGGKLPDAVVLPSLNSDKVLLSAIASAATAAQLRRLTIHDQRHTCAVNMLRAGYRPEVVAHVLGHRDTSLVWKRYGRYVVSDRDYAVPDQQAGRESRTSDHAERRDANAS
jgi:integrase